MIFWRRWLVVACLLVLMFGAALVVLSTPAQEAFESTYFAPRSAVPLSPDAVDYTAFMGAVLGSVMVGWAALLLFVLNGPFRRQEPAGWNMLAVSLLAWFVPDTAYSLFSGFWQNAVLNTVVLVLFAIPLAATYTRFHR